MSTQPLILIVDDMPDIVEVLTVACHMWGYHTLSAHNGVTALGYLLTQPIDIILLDVMMPIMGGEALLKEMKSQELMTGMVIALTAYPSQLLYERLWALGVAQVLSKPFELVALKAAIDACLPIRVYP